MSTCFVCMTAPATNKVKITNLDGTPGGTYVSCSACEPRFVPGGTVASIEVTPLEGSK